MKIFFETGRDLGHNVRGIGVHTKQLISALKKLKPSNIQIIQSKKNADIVHFTHLKPFEKSLVPFFKSSSQKWVLTIHDLIPLIYPKHYPPGIKGRINLWINRIKIRKNIDAIITISETSKKDICRFLGIDPKKVYVVYLAPKKIFKKKKVTKKYNLPKKFVLYDGDVNYNKNIPNLIKACKIAKIPLVIVGKHAIEIGKMDLSHAELAHLRRVDFTKVIRLGYVSDNELCDLFNLTSVYVQPSYYEGFGLPPLEAISVGTPVVASKTQALVEILGTDLDFVDPNDPEDIARGLTNPNKKITLPRKYSWKKTAEETLCIYEKI